ncbi:MAG: Asp-tRNA(Asn)/Glu-tRNA(Gln) amidotransferase subunit GatB [Dehalococcoidia bacterium]|nr:Asp-tRNA(Asn)/Glu-tRNA(Gln) amidotransferase subunit GatB [Dehalococcoidia bacterium]
MTTGATPAVEYETVIGLEVHAQLATESKMFCRCAASYADAPPNTHVCPVCLGMPGVLPTINRRAVEYTIMTALALNCSVPSYSKFDRKNYPYPDLMKGYQISQYDQPLGLKGWLALEVEGCHRVIGITRVHLEEDVAKLLHRAEDGGYSLMDVNRSGMPLMEIVSEPDMRSPEEARQYLMKLRVMLWYLGVSAANMEEGSFRCDANISIRPVGTSEFMPKVEVKNMNSFRAVFRALEYEADRQRQVVLAGGRVSQETRGWVEAEGKTVSQRSKEFAHDYRYFPEPDLPPLAPSEGWVREITAKLPELPDIRCARFITQYAIPVYDATILTGSRELADYFEATVSAVSLPKEISNWLLGAVAGIINDRNTDIANFSGRVSPAGLAELVLLVEREVINAGTGKAVLEEMFATGRSAGDIIREKGLAQISDVAELERVVTEVIQGNAGAVADFKGGKPQALKFMVGQVMRLTKGRASPVVVTELLTKKLGEQ